MYTLMWMPNPDTFRDEIDRLYSNQYPELCFRFIRTLTPQKGITWTMDGDGWSSELLYHNHEFGHFYISRD